MGCYAPPPGDLPNSGIESGSLTFPALAQGFTTITTWEAPFTLLNYIEAITFSNSVSHIRMLRGAWKLRILPRVPQQVIGLEFEPSSNSRVWTLTLDYMGNRWGNSGNSVRLYFLGSKITADGDSSHEIKRRLLLGRKVMTNLDSIFKSREHYFANKGPSSQGYGFSSGHVWMWVGLWRKLSTEEWMLLNCGVGEDSWESFGQKGDPNSTS